MQLPEGKARRDRAPDEQHDHDPEDEDIGLWRLGVGGKKTVDEHQTGEDCGRHRNRPITADDVGPDQLAQARKREVLIHAATPRSPKTDA